MRWRRWRRQGRRRCWTASRRASRSSRDWMTLDRLKSQLYLVPADGGGVVVLAFDEDALVVLVQQRNRRVVDVLAELDLGLPRPHLHLVDFSLALLQHDLVGGAVLFLLRAEGISAEDEDEVPAFGLEDARVEVELQAVVEGDHRPLLRLQRVDLRGRPVLPAILRLWFCDPAHASELEYVLVLVGGEGVPAGALAEAVDDVDLIIMQRYEFLALDQAALPLVLPPDYVDLPVQQAHPEVLALRLHRLHHREGLLRALQVLVLDDQLRRPPPLPDYVVASALRVVDRFGVPVPEVLAVFEQAGLAVRDAVHGCDGLDGQLAEVLREGVEVALPELVGEEVGLAHLVNEGRLAGNGEDLVEALLKVGEQTKDTVVFYGGLEGANLLDEDFVEVALEVLNLVQEVVAEEEMEVGVVVLLELVDLALQELLGLLNYLIQLIQFLPHVVGVRLLDVVAELEQLLVDQLADLVHLRLQLHQPRVVVYVLVHLLVLPRPHCLQTREAQFRQPEGLLAGLAPGEVLVRVPLVNSLAFLAELAVVVAAGRPADRDGGEAVH